MPESTQPSALLMLASQAAPLMSLTQITLIRSELERQPDVPTESEVQLHSNFGFKTNHEYDSEQRTLVVFVQFYTRGKFTEREEEHELFHLEARYIVAYTHSSTEPIPGPCIEAFAQLNGIYNAWPYFREYLQCSTARMGLPTVTLPLITGQAIQDILAKQAAKDAMTAKSQTEVPSAEKTTANS